MIGGNGRDDVTASFTALRWRGQQSELFHFQMKMALDIRGILHQYDWGRRGGRDRLIYDVLAMAVNFRPNSSKFIAGYCSIFKLKLLLFRKLKAVCKANCYITQRIRSHIIEIVESHGHFNFNTSEVKIKTVSNPYYKGTSKG